MEELIIKSKVLDAICTIESLIEMYNGRAERGKEDNDNWMRNESISIAEDLRIASIALCRMDVLEEE